MFTLKEHLKTLQKIYMIPRFNRKFPGGGDPYPTFTKTNQNHNVQFWLYKMYLTSLTNIYIIKHFIAVRK